MILVFTVLAAAPLLPWHPILYVHFFSTRSTWVKFSLLDNGEEATKYLRQVMGDDYNFDTTSSLYALWRTYTSCEYIDDDGGIVFYKNRYGKQVRELDENAVIPEEKKDL
jgi:hypothetical protein